MAYTIAIGSMESAAMPAEVEGRRQPGDTPTLTVYPLAGARGVVLVLPGGGYARQADHEAGPVAEALNAAGFSAAVLHYRVAPHRWPVPLHDAQRAVRVMRKLMAEGTKAQRHEGTKGEEEEGTVRLCSPQAVRLRSPQAEAQRHEGTKGEYRRAAGDLRVAVLGFSAGGHLASTLAVFGDRFSDPGDSLAAAYSAKVAAAVLCYPVIDMGEFAHAGSRENLLGAEPPAELVALLSTHRQVRADSPPAFVWHTADDAAVPVENAMMYAAACRRQGVPAELHVYESGRHGVGLAADHPTISTWLPLAAAFLSRHLGA